VPSYFISPEQQPLTLAAPEEDVVDALESLADALGAPMNVDLNTTVQSPSRPQGKITPKTLSAVVAGLIPENAIVMDESLTSMEPLFAMSQSVAKHTILTQPGGAIGLGMPCATGAALACPDRVVIDLEGDGSAMYTLQSLWTQAREGLNVKTIICNNRSYRILGIEMMRAGAKQIGERAQNLIGLANPALDWPSLSRGMGVPAVQVDTAEDLARELEKALNEQGPRLIDAVL
jgi:acetolactate synthase I/II/III large subunit